jgi:hypothetical protein
MTGKIMVLKNIFKIIFILILFVFTAGLAGCTYFSFFDSSVIESDLKTKIKIEDINTDDFNNQELLKEDINEKIESSDEIKFTEEVRNPFMPFYMKSKDEQSFRNQLTLEKIYSDNENLYAEIAVNSSTYKLKSGDQFAKIYQVQAINEDSIVLLKGDELITIYMNEIYYD